MDRTFTNVFKLLTFTFLICLIEGPEAKAQLVPIIKNFEPASAPSGSLVYIIGSNFLDGGTPTVKTVTFKDGKQAVFSTVDNNTLTATVPNGAISGSVILAYGEGNRIESETSFTVTRSITSFSPGSGTAGTELIINGTGFTENYQVTFYGNKGFILEGDPSVNLFDNSNQVRTTVPTSASPDSYTMAISFDLDDDIRSAGQFIVLENSTLPVELVSFSAKPSALSVVLTWRTATENNNAFFEVQATTDLKGGKFKTVQKVESKVVNSQVPVSYQTEDYNPALGKVIYYRLKQVDLNGDFEYSKVIAVETRKKAKTYSTLKVNPNPFSDRDKLTLEVEAVQAGDLTVALYTPTGRKIISKVILVERGASFVELPITNNLKTGLYILSTNLNGEVNALKIVKQ